MDNIFSAFLSLHTAAFVIGCYILTWITRRGVETGWPSFKPIKKGRMEVYLSGIARWWNSFILYLIPPSWGMVLGAVLYSHLSWPPGFASRQAVIFFGMICGWLSGLLYKFLMKALLKKLGVKEEDVEKAVKKFETKPKVAGDIDDEDTPAETPSGKGA